MGTEFESSLARSGDLPCTPSTVSVVERLPRVYAGP
jgi:hypothetical protein